jgi:hypothetical protein
VERSEREQDRSEPNGDEEADQRRGEPEEGRAGEAGPEPQPGVTAPMHHVTEEEKSMGPLGDSAEGPSRVASTS